MPGVRRSQAPTYPLKRNRLA